VTDPYTVVLRIALAFVFGAVAGIEREWRHKVAGIKTNALVSIGAAAFSLMSNTFGPNNHSPAQLAAAVVSGIGFIGAGVIIHRGATVQGVTTAATLWANASMGVALGLGYFTVGITVFVGVVLVQFVLPPIAAFITAHGPRDRDQ
jgi:putative Mg2+ transporter-C (MgtC) family protein